MQPASDQARPPKNALRRWGPLALIVVLLVGVGVVVAVSAGGGDDDDDTEEPTAELTDGVGAPDPTGRHARHLPRGRRKRARSTTTSGATAATPRPAS